MNGIFGNTRQIDLSIIKDIQFNGESIVNDAKIVELKAILEQGLDSLSNYYNKETTYSRDEINSLIANKQIYNIVSSLPTKNISLSTIYLVLKTKDANTSDLDSYDEYIYINNKWEHVGSFEADFSNYYTTDETDKLLNDTLDSVNGEFKALKQEFDNLKTHVGSIDEVLDAINGEVV